MQNKTNFIYLLSIYIISTAISFLWLGFTDMSYLQSTDGYVIITPDGYYYLKTIDNIIKDAPIVESSVFCYLFAIPLKLLGTENAKDILFFIPPFFAGTFGVGAYLFSREFLQNKYAFLASLLAASNIGAITRLKVGYFDTDIFVFTLPIFIIAFGLRYLRNGKQGELVAAITFAILLSIVYSNGSILLLFSVIGFGVLFLIDRKNQSAKKLTLWLLLASLANPDYILGIFSKAELYLTKSENIADLAYNSTFGFIAESSTVSYVQTMKLISSDPILFALSIIGLLLLVRQKREIIVMFPFLFLGLAAFVLGSRFAPFAAVAVN
ncbi:MAG TPA: STT3 domain-containing protein, partial [Campylobacterales bacterium]|nr:STT3 domain-containing protein [Campylobacterales bacterium]